MNCNQVQSTLSLEDLDARPDPEAMAQHLRVCAGCRSRFPEVASLYGIDVVVPLAVQPPLRFQPWLRVASVAAALMAATWLGIAIWGHQKVKNDQSQPPVINGVNASQNEDTKPRQTAEEQAAGLEEQARRAESMAIYETDITIVSRVENGRVVQVTLRRGRVVHGLTQNRSYSE